MKAFVAITLFAIVAVSHAALTDEQIATVKGYKKECIEATPGLDVALLEKAKQGEFSDDANLAKFLKCFGLKLKFINEDGAYNVPTIKQKLQARFDKDLGEVVDKCVAHDDKDATKNAVHLAKCIRENVPNHTGIF